MKLNNISIYRMHTKIKDGAYAKMSGITLLIVALGALIFALVVAFLQIEGGGKYLAVSILGGMGIAFATGGIIMLRRNQQFQNIIRPIIEYGSLTNGYVKSIEYKAVFGAHWTRGWKHKVTYTYTDENGIEYNDGLTFFCNHKMFIDDKTITIAFFNGQSIFVEI